MTQLKASRILTTELDAVFTCSPTFHACCNSCTSGARYEFAVSDGSLGPGIMPTRMTFSFTSRQVLHCQVYDTYRVLSVSKGLKAVHI